MVRKAPTDEDRLEAQRRLLVGLAAGVDVFDLREAVSCPPRAASPGRCPQNERAVIVRGTLREERPRYWELRIRVGRDPLTGRQRQVSRAVGGSRREGEKALAAFYAEVDTPPDPAARGTVGELLDAWLDQVTDRLPPTTVHEYHRLVQVRIRPALGDRPVKRLDASEVDRFYRAL